MADGHIDKFMSDFGTHRRRRPGSGGPASSIRRRWSAGTRSTRTARCRICAVSCWWRWVTSRSSTPSLRQIRMSTRVERQPRLPRAMPPDSDSFDPKEAPTAPERGARCPRCDGDGSLLIDISEEPTKVRMARRICNTCEGRKWISREELARYVAPRGAGEVSSAAAPPARGARRATATSPRWRAPQTERCAATSWPASSGPRRRRPKVARGLAPCPLERPTTRLAGAAASATPCSCTPPGGSAVRSWSVAASMASAMRRASSLPHSVADRRHMRIRAVSIGRPLAAHAATVQLFNPSAPR